jgi:hypothetical protein
VVSRGGVSWRSKRCFFRMATRGVRSPVSMCVFVNVCMYACRFACFLGICDRMVCSYDVHVCMYVCVCVPVCIHSCCNQKCMHHHACKNNQKDIKVIVRAHAHTCDRDPCFVTVTVAVTVTMTVIPAV